MLMILGIGVFFAAVYVLLTGLTVRQREVSLSVRRARRYGTRNQREIETRRSVNDRLFGPMAARLAGITMKLMPKTNTDQVSNRLLAAGLARSLSPQAYLALKTGLAGLFITFGLLTVITGAMAPIFGLMIALMGAAIGFIAPDFVINNRVRSRRDLMRADLPNVLDLLCVSVEAGLGFDQALSKLSERMEGPLVDEFSLVLHEMRIGSSRSAALKNLSERVDAPGGVAVRPRHHPGRPARHRAVADPARAVAGHARAPPAGRRGEGHEGPGQDAVPDRDLHLPLDVRGRARPGRAEPDEDLLRRLMRPAHVDDRLPGCRR